MTSFYYYEEIISNSYSVFEQNESMTFLISEDLTEEQAIETIAILNKLEGYNNAI